MKELVEVIAKALVENPDEVVVTEKAEGKNITPPPHALPLPSYYCFSLYVTDT